MQPLRKQPAPAASPALHVVAQSHARVVRSIAEIGEASWNACFVGELESYRYLLAVEQAGIAGFEWAYVCVEEDGRTLAAMPAFLTDYQLDTTLDDGAVRRSIRRLRARMPRLLTMRLACLGSPETECGLAGFHPSVAEENKPALLQALLQAFEAFAAQQNCKLLAVKDVPQQHKALWQQAAPGYALLSGMPTAHLHVDFDSIDGYLARLSKESRKDMRRKLKGAADVRVEYRQQIDDVLPQVLALYRDTKARSEFQFEELTEGYFRGVLQHMGEGALCSLYWHGDTLLAANLMLKDKRTLLDKFFCMHGAEGRKHNLYFVSWFTNLQYCIDHGLTHYQSGQACYDNKLRLKSTLNANWMLFKHTHPLIGRLLRLVAPLLAMD